MDVQATEAPKPPYGAFRTFWNFIEQLSENGPLPQLLDRSQMGNRGGSARSELYMALRFFDLIDKRKAPTDALRELVADYPEKTKLRSVVETSYATVIALDLSTATPKQVDERLVEKGSMPSTVQRARLFFLNACESAGIDVGNPLKNAPRSTPRRKARKPPAKTETPVVEAPTSPAGKLPMLVQGLVEKLPADGESWSAAEAKQWLEIARPAFAYAYSFDYPAEGP
jgi:hypothetical protein